MLFDLNMKIIWCHAHAASAAIGVEWEDRRRKVPTIVGTWRLLFRADVGHILGEYEGTGQPIGS